MVRDVMGTARLRIECCLGAGRRGRCSCCVVEPLLLTTRPRMPGPWCCSCCCWLVREGKWGTAWEARMGLDGRQGEADARIWGVAEAEEGDRGSFRGEEREEGARAGLG